MFQEINKENFLNLRNAFNYKRWLRVTIYTVFVLFGDSVATILGRLYFDNGGNSKWMGTFLQFVGFPIVLPYYFISQRKKLIIDTNSTIHNSKAYVLVLASIYIFLGLLMVANCFLHSVGLSYLPISTYSLICTSELAFGTVFSFFLNSQKFTPYIINSLVLLTISTVLLVFQSKSELHSEVLSKRDYTIGFICTIGASAMYGLELSLTQLTMQKVLKTKTLSAVLNMTVYPSLVVACATLLGLFVSGDWKDIKKEMNDFGFGNISYVMVLAWIAILWQIFTIGAEGLIAKFSSLFSNVISALSLPVVQVLAMIFLNDRMDGLKMIALLLAFWGFISYVYQHYLDYYESQVATRDNINGV